MPGQIHGVEAGKVRANLQRVRERAGDGVEILAATKYLPVEEMGALVEAGVGLVGENRLQDLEAKRERWGDSFEWDFIGNLQSRKVKSLLPLCRLIHSVATDSVLASPSSPPSTNSSVSRWAPARTGRSPSRRGRRSSAWALCFTPSATGTGGS
jgi:uncharacterized pyridoxal phosphate-containing UPF0001 family protein